MIIDSLENIKNYQGLNKIYEVLEFTKKTDFSTMPLGKYSIDGDNVFYLVQEYDTKPIQSVGECHKKYIDVQLIVEGEELVGYAPISCEKTLVQENPDTDLFFYDCKMENVTLKTGDFAVLYPNDIHSPGQMKDDTPTKCRKIVFKVKI